MHMNYYSGEFPNWVPHIVHFIEICTLKTLVKIAIFHLAPATDGTCTFSEGLRPCYTDLKQVPRPLLNLSKVEERAWYFTEALVIFLFLFFLTHPYYSKSSTSGHVLNFNMFIGKRLVLSEQMGQF